MKFVDPHPFDYPDAAARKLVEIANGVEAVQDGRMFIERNRTISQTSRAPIFCQCVWRQQERMGTTFRVEVTEGGFLCWRNVDLPPSLANGQYKSCSGERREVNPRRFIQASPPGRGERAVISGSLRGKSRFSDVDVDVERARLLHQYALDRALL